jgi:hypothetical protein
MNCLCKGLSPTKCVLCGKKRSKKLTEDEKLIVTKMNAKAKFYRETWNMLKKFRMASCGIPELDKEIKKMYGEWL